MIDDWIETRESYINWVATSNLRSLLEKEEGFQWCGMSLWWALNVTQKDNFQVDGWYKKLHDALIAHKKNTSNYIPPFEVSRNEYLTLTTHLVKRIILKLLLIMFSKNKHELSDDYIWFHSLIYNLNESNGAVNDRLYCETPSLAHNFNAKPAYIVKYFSAGKFTIKTFLKDIKKFKKIRYEKIICDQYIGVYEILKIYLLTYKAKKSLLNILKSNESSKLFNIDGLDVGNILIPYILDSFEGKIQDSLIYAQGMKNALSKVAPKGGIMVTYGELLPMFKPVCHLLHTLINPIRIIAVQHAYSNKNKLASYYRKIEFYDDGESKYISYSPRPDLYLVQGSQYAKILSEFFDEDKIKIIGCLKFDDLKREKIQEDSLAKFKYKKKVLVAPSLLDEPEIEGVLKDSKEILKCCIIYSPHPISKDKNFRDFLRQLAGDNYIEVKGLSTARLISDVDFVVTGYSSVAIEARIFNIDSVRLYSSNNPPKIDESDPITIISSGRDFDKYISNGCSKKLSTKNTKIIEEIFYRIDGNSGYRMWEEIDTFRKRGNVSD